MSSAFPITVIPRKRRGIELVLVIFALAITLGGYALVDLNVNGRLSPMFPYLAGGCVLHHSPALPLGIQVTFHLKVR